jgi:hypothetical protein
MRLIALALLMSTAAVAEERPLSYSRPIEKADLDGRSLRELTLLRNWIFAKRGNVFRRPWLKAYFHEVPWYHEREPLSTEGLAPKEVELDDQNALVIAEYESALTPEQLGSMRNAARQKLRARSTERRTVWDDDEVELRLLSVRLGGWAGEGPRPADLTPLENPERLDTLLKLSDLDGLSGRDLKLLRNTVFAKHGRPFVTELVKGHFKTVTWYKADEKYSDALLTDVDKKNVKLIVSLEEKLKRPVAKKAPPDGWYGAA